MVHSREWVVVHDEGVLVLDTVSGARGEVVESRVHLAPGWEIERATEGSWRCESGDRVFYIIAFQPWRGALEECRVWRRFGPGEKAALLALRAEGDVELGAYFLSVRPHDAVEFRPWGRLLVLDGWTYSC